MSGSSGFKIVAIVVVLSIGAVIVIDRFIEKGAFTSFSIFRGNQAAPANDAGKPPDKKDVPSARKTAKGTKAATPAVEPAMAEHARAINETSPINRNAVLQPITPGMTRAQVSKLFGEPTLRVIETRDRKVVERLIYVNANRHTRTVVVLENGKAARSYTESHFEVEAER